MIPARCPRTISFVRAIDQVDSPYPGLHIMGTVKGETLVTRFATIFSVTLALLLAGCAYKHEPIYNVDRAMPPGVEHLSPDRTRDAIISAGQQLDWVMTPVAPGHLEATENAEKYAATVDIYYTPARLQITIKSTRGFLQTATTIHDHYNLWIRNLESRIMGSLSAAAARGQNG